MWPALAIFFDLGPIWVCQIFHQQCFEIICALIFEKLSRPIRFVETIQIKLRNNYGLAATSLDGYLEKIHSGRARAIATAILILRNLIWILVYLRYTLLEGSSETLKRVSPLSGWLILRFELRHLRNEGGHQQRVAVERFVLWQIYIQWSIKCQFIRGAWRHLNLLFLILTFFHTRSQQEWH